MMQEARQERTLPLLLYLFTSVTGLVDAVSYIALGHVFTANMTGNIVLLGFALAGVPGLSALRSLAALAAFLVGALIGGVLRRHWRRSQVIGGGSLHLGARPYSCSGQH
jgi:uncharacterized membrane protein YoaK (UPF0700 family)